MLNNENLEKDKKSNTGEKNNVFINGKNMHGYVVNKTNIENFCKYYKVFNVIYFIIFTL
jgi:hypothetical protein